jgi:hypothetical protein
MLRYKGTKTGELKNSIKNHLINNENLIENRYLNDKGLCR